LRLAGAEVGNSKEVRLFFLSAGRQHLAPTSTERAPDRFKDFWRSL
jgi:hypothetical protein